MSIPFDDATYSPEGVRHLAAADLPAFAQCVREEILSTVSHTGGHLASSLGAVELVISLLRVFDPTHDRIVWDVGHQTYAWKILTGRRDKMGTIRRLDGLSGFCNPDETPCDAFVTGHAGNALSVAEGLAVARDLQGGDEQIVAVVGDAALANGMSLEALNNCGNLKSKLILIVNDNAMSISRNVGACARILGRLLTSVRYNRAKAAVERAGHRARLTFLRNLYHRVERALKSLLLGNAFFESLGLRYIGPVDGHDILALTRALSVARADKRSVVVHVVTRKGKGFAPAEADSTRWHGVAPFDLAHPVQPPPSARCWSEVFGTALVERAHADARICALTAAMRDGTGLAQFAQTFPTRFFDVGICEEHLVTFAAGLAKAGLRPVVAVYSSFLQRAVDQVMHDVCLLNLPVVFAVDRAGCVGRDGRTHHGMFDLAMLRALPNLTICQPSDADDLRRLLARALATGGPWVIRYPRGDALDNAADEQPTAEAVVGSARVLCGAEAHIQLWALGDQVAKALDVRQRLAAQGRAAGVVDARFVKPFDAALLARQRAHGAFIVSLENGSVAGGFGEALGADLRFGWPDVFVGHGTVAELERRHGFDAASLAARIAAALAAHR